jgi:hypothetical protein
MFKIESFHRPTDGDDFYPALCRAQQIKFLDPSLVDSRFSAGWTILFQAKEYRFSRPIELVRCMRLVGAGGSDQPGTRFVFVNDTPGLFIHHGGSTGLSYQATGFWDETEWKARAGFKIPQRMLFSTADLERPTAEGSIIENIEFIGTFTMPSAPFSPYMNGQPFIPGSQSCALFFDRDPQRISREAINRHGTYINPFESTQKPDRRSHGIIAYGRFTLRNCVVSGFSGHGIYIYGNTSLSNADGWQIETVTTRNNGNDGLHIFGSDATLGIAKNIYALNNRFWGIVDLSYLGNQFWGGQASYNHYGGFLRPRILQLPTDTNVEYATGSGMPLPGSSLLRWIYGEDNNAVISDTSGKIAPNYTGKFLQFNRFISAYNVLEYCLLNNSLYDVKGGVINQFSVIPATHIDTGYMDTGCNTVSLEGEFIPSFNTGIRIQDRLSLMAFGSNQEKVWIRAMKTADAMIPPSRSMPGTTDPVKPQPEIIFFTDPVAGGHVGSVYCIIGKNPSGQPIWGHRKFGNIQL